MVDEPKKSGNMIEDILFGGTSEKGKIAQAQPPAPLTTEEVEFDYKKRQEQQEAVLRQQEREAALAMKRAEIKGMESQTAKRYAEIEKMYGQKTADEEGKQMEKEVGAVKFGSRNFGREPIYIKGGAAPDLRAKYTPMPATGVTRSLENSRAGLSRLHETVLSRPTVSYTGSAPMPGARLVPSGGVHISPTTSPPPAVLALGAGHSGKSVGGKVPQVVYSLGNQGARTNVVSRLGTGHSQRGNVLSRLAPRRRR